MKEIKTTKQDKRLAVYVDEPTLARIQAKQQELHRKGLAVSLSRVLGMIVAQGLQRQSVKP